MTLIRLDQDALIASRVHDDLGAETVLLRVTDDLSDSAKGDCRASPSVVLGHHEVEINEVLIIEFANNFLVQATTGSRGR